VTPSSMHTSLQHTLFSLHDSPHHPALHSFPTRRSSDLGTLQVDWQLATQHLLTLGTDAQRDGVASSVAYAVSSRRDIGGFVEYQGGFASERFSISARHDDNQQFGGQATGSAAWSHRFVAGPRLTGSFGTAFRAPTFNELYYPF